MHPFLGHNAAVRVKGIDSAEIRGKTECEKQAARTSRRLVENLLKNAKRIDLANVEKEKYGRILADVIFDGRDLKEVLIKNGMAYPYFGATKKRMDWCRRLPAQAL